MTGADEEISEAEELFYEGTDLHAEGRHDEALACFDKALGIDPGYTDALLGKAMAHAAKAELEAAIAITKRLIELKPDEVLAHTTLSRFYQQAGQIAEAEEAAAKARTLDWKRQLAEDENEG